MLHLTNTFDKITTTTPDIFLNREGKNQVVPFCQIPNFTLQQLANFNKHEWDLNIFHPFCLLNENKLFGASLRFLQYFPYLPKGIKITKKALNILSTNHIGRSFGEIATFVWRDLVHPPHFEEPTNGEIKKFLNDFEENRTKMINEIFSTIKKGNSEPTISLSLS